MSLGAFIRSTREAQGLTGQRLAQQVGCHPAMLSRIEHDNARPSLSLLCRLFTALGLVHTRGTAVSLPVDLSEGDRALLSAYHALDGEGQSFVRTVLRREVRRCEAPRGIPIIGAAVDIPADSKKP